DSGGKPRERLERAVAVADVDRELGGRADAFMGGHEIEDRVIVQVDRDDSSSPVALASLRNHDFRLERATALAEEERNRSPDIRDGRIELPIAVEIAERGGMTGGSDRMRPKPTRKRSLSLSKDELHLVPGGEHREVQISIAVEIRERRRRVVRAARCA